MLHGLVIENLLNDLVLNGCAEQLEDLIGGKVLRATTSQTQVAMPDPDSHRIP
jgi:hypothetical protein